jgi:hypothetical protein
MFVCMTCTELMMTQMVLLRTMPSDLGFISLRQVNIAVVLLQLNLLFPLLNIMMFVNFFIHLFYNNLCGCYPIMR